MGRDVVPPGTLAARDGAGTRDDLGRRTGGVAALDVQGRHVRARAAGGPRTVRVAGKGAGRPVGGLTNPGAVRTVERLGSGLIGPGDPRKAEDRENGRQGMGGGVRVPRAAMIAGGPGSGRTGRGRLPMTGHGGTGRRVSAGTRIRAPEAAGRPMGVPGGRGVLGRTTRAPGRQIAAPRDHDGGPRGKRAGETPGGPGAARARHGVNGTARATGGRRGRGVNATARATAARRHGATGTARATADRRHGAAARVTAGPGHGATATGRVTPGPSRGATGRVRVTV